MAHVILFLRVIIPFLLCDVREEVWLHKAPLFIPPAVFVFQDAQLCRVADREFFLGLITLCLPVYATISAGINSPSRFHARTDYIFTQ